MKKLMHILFLSCLKATLLVEKKMHFRISFMEKMQLRMHKMMCSACSGYEKHSRLIDQTIARGLQGEATPADIEKLKTLIHARLADQK